MILPGVPRSIRIKFVEQLIGLLLEEGMDGITEQEHSNLYKMMRELMDSVTPVPEKVEEDAEEKPVAC
ncbi:MAG: hypothetical protein KAR40_14660 [Candidatus Sabulitectum sp.]|nr:hypothetical protein [Candidatus Sabulitectum sp.]